jgi:hypothetical protein
MPRVRVAVRCRPALMQEQGKPCGKVETNEVDNTVRVVSSASNAKVFSFDTVIPETATQHDVFQNVIPMVDHALDGLHATVFAYGQTGSGKTFTMEGLEYVKDGAGRPRPNLDTEKDRHGIIPRTIEVLFDRARQRMGSNANVQYRIAVSYMQLYNEKVTDLLNPNLANSQLLKIRWNRNNKFTVDNLFHLECDNAEHTRELFLVGVKNKVMGSHAMNQQSSRSHCLFTFYITAYDPSDRDATVKSELTLVDLAGSEKLGMLSSDPSKLLVKESIEINASLLALGKVITALANMGKGTASHVPYRDSKLTKLLQHSLGGNSMTMMLACISPLDAHCDETTSTLLYAGRARNITNDPHVNEDPRTALIRQLRTEIVSLKEQLAHYQQLCAAGLTASPVAVLAASSGQQLKGANSNGGASPPPSSAADRELAEKLIASCEMLKHLIDVNKKLRDAVDSINALKAEADQKEVELQAENISLRERIEVLESIVLSGEEGPRDDFPLAPASAHGRPRQAESLPPRARTPTAVHAPLPPSDTLPDSKLMNRSLNSLRDTVEASRTVTRQSQQQKLRAYSKKYRDPRAVGNYDEYYGLAKKATDTRSSGGRQAKIVADVETLMRKAGPLATAMVPLSLQSGGNYGSLAFGGTATEVDELEERRRRRDEKRAALEEQHRRLQQGFAAVDAVTRTTAPIVASEPARPQSSGRSGSSSEQLFSYLSSSESEAVFTADQLQRLRERRGVAGAPPPPLSRRPDPPPVPLAPRAEAERARAYQRELQSAQQLISSLTKKGV